MSVRKTLRRVRKALSPTETAHRLTPTDLGRAAVATLQMSRFFYLFVVFAIATRQIGNGYSGTPTHALWPIEMLEGLTGIGWFANTTAVLATGMGMALLAAVLPRFLILRLGVFLYLLFYIAMSNSYGSINHSKHAYIYVSFALLLLPGRDKPKEWSRKDVLSCLATLWLTQSMLLLPYTLSGLWRIWHSNFELLASDSMVRILLTRATDSDNFGPLLSQIVEYEYLAQFILWVAVYVELFALLAVFRPHLHRLFGVALIGFHIGSYWIMGIPFHDNILMIGLFLVLSPTAPTRFSLSSTTRSLPIIGMPFRARARLRATDRHRQVDRVLLVYDGECPLCSNYAQFLKLKQSVGELTLIDARQGGPVVEEVRSLPHDLDDGMVAVVDGRYYIGHEALNVLARLSESCGVFNRFNRLAFSSPVAARLGYPWLKLGRWLLLKLKGVAPISHSRLPDRAD